MQSCVSNSASANHTTYLWFVRTCAHQSQHKGKVCVFHTKLTCAAYAKSECTPMLKSFLICFVLSCLNSLHLLPCLYFLYIIRYAFQEVVIFLFGVLLFWQFLTPGFCICFLVLKEACNMAFPVETDTAWSAVTCSDVLLVGTRYGYILHGLK